MIASKGNIKQGKMQGSVAQDSACRKETVGEMCFLAELLSTYSQIKTGEVREISLASLHY